MHKVFSPLLLVFSVLVAGCKTDAKGALVEAKAAFAKEGMVLKLEHDGDNLTCRVENPRTGEQLNVFFNCPCCLKEQVKSKFTALGYSAEEMRNGLFGPIPTVCVDLPKMQRTDCIAVERSYADGKYECMVKREKAFNQSVAFSAPY